MNWFKVIIANNIPPVLYHATYGPFVDSIFEQGLIPNHTQCWEFTCAKGVYLSSDQYVAESFAETADNSDIPEEYYDDITILQIDTTKLDASKFAPDPQMHWENPKDIDCWIYKDVVPPNAISILRG